MSGAILLFPHVSSWHALGQLYLLPVVMMTGSVLATFLLYLHRGAARSSLGAASGRSFSMAITSLFSGTKFLLGTDGSGLYLGRDQFSLFLIVAVWEPHNSCPSFCDAKMWDALWFCPVHFVSDR